MSPVAATTQSVEWLVRLLAYIGGVASTLVGSWISSKIRAYHETKVAHLEEIKQKVLIPIRRELGNFRPFLFPQTPVVSVGWGPKEYYEKARVTELTTEEGPLLAGVFPGASLFTSTESALLEDARKNHFRELMADLDKFV